ncbi:MAG: hypothetical protein LBD58_08015 [Treponema sp.]|jgi:cyclic pyranopterin phosphate synthase|nr:hypothetical protein [Treponema sp.]
MPSNGVALFKMARRLKEAGIQKVNASLGSLNAQKFKAITGHDEFDQVINNRRASPAVL